MSSLRSKIFYFLIFSITFSLVIVGAPRSEASVTVTTYSAIFWDGREFKEWEQIVPVNKIKFLEKQLKSNNSVVASGVPGYRKILSSGDPSLDRQWGLAKLDFPEINSLSSGEGVTIAVVDTGVDGGHPDLKHSLVDGYDVYDGSTKGLFDPNGHGTHVAGIIAGAYNNGVHGSGIAPSVKIMPIRVLDETGYGDDSDVAKGILWAVANGAHIINLSLGGTDRDPLLEDAVNFAKSNGVAVVAAAGNDGMRGSPISYPAAHASTIAVAATTSMDTHAPFSTKQDYVDVAAPGMSILSTWRGGGESNQSGTSMATPFVAGAIALVMDYKKINALAAAELVTGTSSDISPDGKDSATGAGLIDPLAALTLGNPRSISERKRSLAPPDWSLVPINLPELPSPTLPPMPTFPGGGWVPPGFPTGEPYFPVNPPGNFPPPAETPPTTPPVISPDPGEPSMPDIPNNPTNPTPFPPVNPIDNDSIKLQPSLKTSSKTSKGQKLVTVRLVVGKVPLYGKQLILKTKKGNKKFITDSLGRVTFTLKEKRATVSFKGDSFYRQTVKVVRR